MKTILPTLLAFFFILSIQAQTKVNSNYLIEVTKNESSSKIIKFQKMVANYNIKQAPVYKKGKKTTYDVVFEERNCKVEATYNSVGQIINSIEKYEDMRLPYELASSIVKEYPKWNVSSNNQNIKYNDKEGLLRTYEIVIKKDSESKILKFKFENQDNSIKYIALNEKYK